MRQVISKAQILENHLGFSYYMKHEYIRKDIFRAMDEYANYLNVTKNEANMEQDVQVIWGADTTQNIKSTIQGKLKEGWLVKSMATVAVSTGTQSSAEGKIVIIYERPKKPTEVY